MEPLLQCLKTDTCLTRSRTLLGVCEAANTALEAILHTNSFPVCPNCGLEIRKEVAAEIREYWQKNRGLSLQDRWYATLKDDQAEPKQWLEVAQKIASSKDVQAGGESLRAQMDPSISDLLIKRMNGATEPWARPVSVWPWPSGMEKLT